MGAYLSGKHIASEKDQISILIIGRVGVGKSALVNGMIGRKVAEENNGIKPVTTRINSYEHTIHVREIGRDVAVKMWDTPGLSAAFKSDKKEDQLKTDLAEHFKEMDLVFYCLDMRCHLGKSYWEELESISKKAGPDLWKHITFVLTFANKVLPTDQRENRVEDFEKLLKTWIEGLPDALTKNLKISEDIVKEIPIVPTGHGNDPPPDRKDWFSPLWETAIQRARPDIWPTISTISDARMTQVFRNQREEREYMQSGKKTVCMMFVGKLGTGKSSLINGIMGEKVANEGHGVYSQTNQITPHVKIFHLNETDTEVTMKLLNTPGLGDPMLSEVERQRLAEDIAKQAKDIDHVFYCFNMSSRLDMSDTDGLERFSRAAGQDIWKNTTLVLTFANQVVPHDPQEDKKKCFDEQMTMWNDALSKRFKEKLRIPEEILKEIPIVPTGYQNECPPDRSDWFTPLWGTAMKRMKPEAQPTMYAISKLRIDRRKDFSQQEAQTERQGRQQAHQEKEQAERVARVARQEKGQAERRAEIAEGVRREAETTIHELRQSLEDAERRRVEIEERANTRVREAEQRPRDLDQRIQDVTQRLQCLQDNSTARPTTMELNAMMKELSAKFLRRLQDIVTMLTQLDSVNSFVNSDDERSRPSEVIDERKDWPTLCGYLYKLKRPQIELLGGVLGLDPFKLQHMQTLPDDMVRAWLLKQDNVIDRCGEQLSWNILVKALVEIGQKGIANQISKDKCTKATT